MRIIFFGPPGAGKGTQAKLLSSYLGIPHLSTGEILRLKLSEDDELSSKLRHIMTSGNLVSDEILNEIVSIKLLADDCKKGFILDGYPRTATQSEYLNSFMDKQDMIINKVINIDLNDKNIENRITLRSRIENRTDDSLEVIRNRIIKYNNETKPISQFYKSKYPLIFFELNGDQKIEKIHSDIINIVKKCWFFSQFYVSYLDLYKGNHVFTLIHFFYLGLGLVWREYLA